MSIVAKGVKALAYALVASCLAPAAMAQSVPVITPFEPVNPGGVNDRLGEARQLAALIVAQDGPAPKSIADVGSFTGEFLEAFLEQFPQAKGQWTEPVDSNQKVAERRFARFGPRVTYRIGCPGRDITLGCLPADMDVLVSSWVTIHRSAEQLRDFHRHAFAVLPKGGWVVIMDHAGAQGDWARRLKGGREQAVGKGLAMLREGPPVHHPEFVTPTLDMQLAAMREAGFADPRVVWTRLDTVLMLARKP
ncbi:class I SAM-dependent methyltransferase [Novosphingobium umbonatum]|uniref:Class I SAM-dependent methyltransferase n=1 Tax=Novosphingobium umbonatum TaxID=1908524 RepID=A0A437N7P8_9SPHN|nr:class I SAM-dependent methyltransferase [Novosphingobium umbonatum]RVU05911.1 class I SAM-dependent methyltransferase [Novosphingobium umbonatum]